MKNFSNRMLLALLLAPIGSHAQQLEWAYSIQHTGVQNNAQFLTSNGANFAICGSVASNVSYDLINQNMANSGYEAFVGYYNANAEIQWSVAQPDGGYVERIATMYMDDAGALYTVGRFSGTLDFDPGPATNNLSAILGDVFMQKFDNSGNLVWASHTSCDGAPRKMAMKSNGNLVVIGRLQDTTTAYLYDGSPRPLEKGVYLLEFATNGDVVEAYSLATPDSFNDQTAITIDENDNIYIGCSVDGNMDLDLKAGVLSESSNSGYDCVLVKYDANYNYLWHKRFGDVPSSGPDGWDFINDLKFDNGYLYATGWFTWTTDFDPDDNPAQWVYTAGTGSQTPDGFVVKYDPNGVIQWVQEAGGHPSIPTNTDVWFTDLVVHNGQIVVSGELNGGADFDGSASDFILNTADNGLALCYAQYDTDGNFQTAWLIDGIVSANEKERGIEQLADGIVAYGTFQKKCDFDPLAGNFILSTDSTGQFYVADNDLFVAHYSIDGIGGIEESTAEEMRAYPNPTSGLVLIQSECVLGEIKVRNTQGILVSTHQGNTVDLQSQPAGIYFLEFEGATPLRVVKQ